MWQAARQPSRRRRAGVEAERRVGDGRAADHDGEGVRAGGAEVPRAPSAEEEPSAEELCAVAEAAAMRQDVPVFGLSGGAFARPAQPPAGFRIAAPAGAEIVPGPLVWFQQAVVAKNYYGDGHRQKSQKKIRNLLHLKYLISLDMQKQLLHLKKLNLFYF